MHLQAFHKFCVLRMPVSLASVQYTPLLLDRPDPSDDGVLGLIDNTDAT